MTNDEIINWIDDNKNIVLINSNRPDKREICLISIKLDIHILGDSVSDCFNKLEQVLKEQNNVQA